VATIAGPLLGGWITDNFSWRWIFYINVPVGLITIAIIASVLPNIKHTVKNRSIDYWGALLLTVGLVPLLLAFVWGGSQYAWGSWQIIVLFCVSAAAFTAFVLAERRVPDPILALNLFKTGFFNFRADRFFD
jgi:MFS family permease